MMIESHLVGGPAGSRAGPAARLRAEHHRRLPRLGRHGGCCAIWPKRSAPPVDGTRRYATVGPPSPSKPRPLIVRPGARFACAGDGLCCTDMHALGPLTRSEDRAMCKLVPTRSLPQPTSRRRACASARAAAARSSCQRTLRRARAVWRRQKPVGCKRFPYGLLNTPDGGRVTTEHRCPCRTLG